MRYRMLDIDGDYSFGRGQQNITYGVFAVAQAIKTRLGLLQGEWWENTEEGLPLFQSILGSINSQFIADTLIRDRIIKTKDVISIENFESTFENRKYSFQCKVLTKYGYVDINKNF